MRRVNIIIIIVVIVAGAALFSVMGPGAQGIQSTFLGFISPFMKTATAVHDQVKSVSTGLNTKEELEEANSKLETENKALRATNQILRDIEAENNKLRNALEYRQRSVFKLLPARVISRDSSTWWSTVIINRGFEDGVETDQPILTDVGLVGKTTTVSKNTSIVLLATDETCKVAAKIEGTNEKGILSGERVTESNGPGEMQLNFLSKAANLQPGQNVYTEGVSKGNATGVFPSGILIGKVKSFKIRPQDGQALVEPAVDLSSVEDVFVVVGAK